MSDYPPASRYTMNALKPIRRWWAVAALAVSPLAVLAAEPYYVWWEAEDPVERENGSIQRFQPGSEEYPVASEAAWLAFRAPEGEKTRATWEIEVPAGGKSQLWARKFWKHGPFRWRIDSGEWRVCGRDIALHDDSYIRLHNGLNWVFLGEIEVDAGRRMLEVESLESRGGWLDCFLLTNGPFLPRGRLKPGEPTGAAEPGWFAFEPDADPYTDSPIDLAWMNEERAGQSGFLSRQGGQFVLGNGEPVRFWLTQGVGLKDMREPMVDLHARRLAKAGVNLVRVGLMDLFDSWRRGNDAQFAERLARLHYKVAALRDEGIYTYLGHLFWDTQVTARTDDDLPGLRKGEKATAALFFNEPLRQHYLEFVEAVVTPVNPHTGRPLAEEPAIAVIEIMNESNTLFWTMHPDRIARHTRELIEEAFGEYASQKYGSIDAAIQHWGRAVEGDDPDAGKAGILPAWFMTSGGFDAHPRRAADQITFLAQRQYAFYADMVERFRGLGIRPMISGSNWKTADPSTLGPLEYYSYTATDLVAKNEYFSPIVIEDKRFHAVDVGDQFVPLSAMRAPEIAGPLMNALPHTHPFAITENNWDNPNPYRAEFPFLVATYGRMSGVDAWSFFSYKAPLWDTQMDVWNVTSPSIFGQFPALALMYRRGDVVEGPPVVVEHVDRAALAQGEPIALPEIQYKDAVWKKTLGGDPQVEVASEISPLAFFAGPVRLIFEEGPPRVETRGLEALIDEEAGIIENTNGQLEWHYGQGHVRVNTPLSQGVCGYLSEAGPVRLDDVLIESSNAFGVIVAVSLDGLPLAESARVLLQAVTEDKPHGYETRPIDDEGGREVVSLGGWPFMVREIEATIALRGHAGATVTVLDVNGYRTDGPVATADLGESLRVEFPKDAMYVLIETPR